MVIPAEGLSLGTPISTKTMSLQVIDFEQLSGQRGSNSHSQLGRLELYH
jgi:hypothetical protein